MMTFGEWDTCRDYVCDYVYYGGTLVVTMFCDMWDSG